MMALCKVTGPATLPDGTVDVTDTTPVSWSSFSHERWHFLCRFLPRLADICPDRQAMAPFLLNHGTEDEMECQGYKTNSYKACLCLCLVVLCGGGPVGVLLAMLVFRWRPDWKLRATKSRCPLYRADAVLLKDISDRWWTETVDIIYVPVDESMLHVPDWLAPYINACPDFHLDPKTQTVAAKQYGSFGQVADCSYKEEDGDEEDVKETTSLTSVNDKERLSVRFFDHQRRRYIWDASTRCFTSLRGLDDTTPCSYFYQAAGMSREEQNRKHVLYGENTIYIEVKSYFRLLIEEVLNPFYVFQIFSVILWSLNDYYVYASCIVVISVISISVELYEIRKQAETLRDMVALEAEVSVWRGGDEYEDIPGQELVPGDVITIPPHGTMMACDAVLITGNCIVNESMLTGESVPVTKTPLPSPPRGEGQDPALYMSEEHKRHTLFCGTQVIQTRYYGGEKVKAVVIRTGFLSAKGELVRSILFPKPMGFKFYQDAMRFLAVLAGLAVIGFSYSVYVMISFKASVKDVIVRALDMITVIVPPALPAAMTIGSVYAQRRLKKEGIFCISPPRINISGKTKLVCFDKTGTLTEDGLDLWGVVPADMSVVRNAADLPRGPLLAAMASCHSLTLIEGEMTGDPLDLKMFEATDWLLEEPGPDNTRFDILAPTVVKPVTADTFIMGATSQTPYEIGILRQFPFSSSLQRMSVITRTLGNRHMDVYLKGAPEMVASLCIKETVPSEFHNTLMRYTLQGFRVIAFAWKVLDTSIKFHHLQKIQRDQVETDLTFLGLMVMQNALKPETTPTIHQLNDANIRTVMVTGDNMLTAVSVARNCGMVLSKDTVILVNASPPEDGQPAHVTWTYSEHPTEQSLVQGEARQPGNWDSGADMSEPLVEYDMSYQVIPIKEPEGRYHFAVSGKSFAVIRSHFSDLIPKICVRGTVFARMSPNQKAQLVESLQDLGYCVAMCGDGANDCGALKTAHAGISLSEAEASVASPFTSKIPNIQCVPTVIREGRAALVTSFGSFKYMALYSMVQFVSVITLYSINSNLGDIQYLYIDLAITTTVALFMGWQEAYPKLVPQRPPGSLMAPVNLFSVLSQVVLMIAVQVGTFLYLKQQPWFKALKPNPNSDNILCYETTVVFSVSSYLYIILAAAFSKGRPYRRPLYTNYVFMVCLVILLGFSTLLLLHPFTALAKFIELMVDMPFHFRLTLLGIISAYCIVVFVVEDFVVSSQVLRRLFRLRKKIPKNKYKLLEKELAENPDWPPVGETTYAMEEKYQDSTQS
ncbi:ATP13A3 [Branchiostoma lanceolatum]|uniref:Cation-transporting ATPase n=1 Tax=Branchiostoma lanceolatum TaxID=7740 RepID=A0A8J9W8T6_BRALA|nr:ATP13A3 [Branchiostoma lanceolatum]